MPSRRVAAVQFLGAAAAAPRAESTHDRDLLTRSRSLPRLQMLNLDLRTKPQRSRDMYTAFQLIKAFSEVASLAILSSEDFRLSEVFLNVRHFPMYAHAALGQTWLTCSYSLLLMDTRRCNEGP